MTALFTPTVLCACCGAVGVKTRADRRAVWVDDAGHTDGKVLDVCLDCLEAGSITGPHYREVKQ